jgi:hypothetical protein
LPEIIDASERRSPSAFQPRTRSFGSRASIGLANAEDSPRMTGSRRFSDNARETRERHPVTRSSSLPAGSVSPRKNSSFSAILSFTEDDNEQDFDAPTDGGETVNETAGLMSVLIAVEDSLAARILDHVLDHQFGCR